MNTINQHDDVTGAARVSAGAPWRSAMRTNLISLIAAGALAASPALAFAGDWETRGEASVRYDNVNESSQMSKFNEYRDIKDGATGSAEINAEKDSVFHAGFTADDIGRRTQEFGLTGGKYGEWGIGLGYDATPHNFYDGARTIFDNPSAGVYTVDDSIQAAIQAANTAPIKAGAPDKAIKAMVAQTRPIDLKLDRKTTEANVFFNITPNIRFSADVSQEKREGNRPWSNYYSFGFIRESEEPIDYTSTIMNGRIGYQNEDYKLMFNYQTSSFSNAVDTALYDNPWVASTSAVGGNLSPAAEYVLVPDNSAMQYSLSGAANLPMNGRLTGLWSVGQHKQTDPFILAGKANPLVKQAALSRDSLDGKADVQNRDFVLSFAPVELLDVKVRYNYYHYDNKTEMVDWYQYATADRSTSAGVRRNLPLSFEYTTWAGDLGLNLAQGFKLGLNYEQITNNRVHREIDSSKDTNYRLSASYRPTGDMGWVFVKASYKMSQRRGDHYVDITEEEGYGTIASGKVTEGNATVAQLPMLQKYDIGDRDRSEINLLAKLDPTDDLSATLTYLSAADDFKVMDRHIPSNTERPALNGYPALECADCLYGLTNNKMSTYGLNVDWAAHSMVMVNAWYNYEKYSYTQSTRRSNAGTASPYTGITPFKKMDFSIDGEDTVSVYGLGLSGGVDAISYSLDSTFSDGKGSHRIYGPFIAIGNGIAAGKDGTALDTSYLTDITNKLTTVNAKADYNFTKAFSLGLAYLYEKFEIVDWSLDQVNVYNPSGANTGTAAVNGNLLLGVANNSYDVSVVSAVAKVKF